MVRRTLVLVLAAAALTAGSARAASVCTGSCFAAPAGSGALFLFSGHGWGHGVGMSQYGAYGYAQHGFTYQQILAHYYPGTTLGPAPVSTIRVLLADKQKSLAIASEAPFTVRDGAGKTHTLAAGAVTLRPALSIGGRKLPPPLTFAPGRGGALSLKTPYRGRILVDVVDGKLRAINIVGLEQYLAGVVPAEMPASWSSEALKAQAVAARSYALATRAIGAPFDVYSDTRSQMYLGIAHEAAATTAAVNATKRQVVLYNGAVATTFFSSTSGGKTESSLGWTGTALPYLVSVPDPYDDISPYHDWGPVPVTAASIVKALKLSSTIVDATTTPDPAGRVAQLTFATPFEPLTITATKLRSAVGLRSTWFTVGVLSLTPPAPNGVVTYGGQVTLGGSIRGVSGVTLEQKPLGGSWQPVTTVPPASGLRLLETPGATTDYRLATSTAAAGSVRIRVAPALTASLAVTGATGTVQPLLPGATVVLQQQNADATWTAISTGTVAGDGTFDLPAALATGGTYRVSVTATGFAPGTTPAQVVAR